MAPPRPHGQQEADVPKVSEEGRAAWHQAIADKVQKKLNAQTKNTDWEERLEAAAEAGASLQAAQAAEPSPKKDKHKHKKHKHHKHKHHKHKHHSPSSSSSEDGAVKKHKKHHKRSRSRSVDSESSSDHHKVSKKSKHRHKD
ncbi:hypothetical protein WJX73_002778 [Symbiochloris irregularis]|uniref:Uncharacterized protein n=1 Tax=Symbiochloris irregularis TaxID=706552 RepID=A0AAW1PGK3_9CHLO